MINSNLVIIVIVICFALYLVYNQRNETLKNNVMYYQQMDRIQQVPEKKEPVAKEVSPFELSNPFADTLKDYDYYAISDPLTYPQMRLPRDVLERYNEYYQKTGSYPPFGLNTKPYLADTPILNGLLQKMDSPLEPFNQDVPKTIPLFRQMSIKNNNRYYYYILDQTHFSKLELKIPFDNVVVNGKKFLNANYYGIPELFDEDVIEGIPMYKDAKFKVVLYKTYGPN